MMMIIIKFLRIWPAFWTAFKSTQQNISIQRILFIYSFLHLKLRSSQISHKNSENISLLTVYVHWNIINIIYTVERNRLQNVGYATIALWLFLSNCFGLYFRVDLEMKDKWQ